ncbi:helix-turn-helix domain-containing protein [Corynebacterium phoceense]
MARKASPGPLGISREVIRIIRGELSKSELSQLDIAKFSGISQSQVSRILSFEKELTVDQCDAICMALGLNIQTVVDEAQELALMHTTDAVTISTLVASDDPLDPVERRQLLNQHNKKAYEHLVSVGVDEIAEKRTARSRNSEASVSSLHDRDELVERINAGLEPVAAQEATEPLEENQP